MNNRTYKSRLGADEALEVRLHEAILLRRWQDGDMDAFNQLIGENLDSVQRLALKLTHDPEMADDVVSEVLLRVHRSVAAFRGGAQIKTWMHRIVVNCVLDAKRKRSIHFTSLDLSHEEKDGSLVEQQIADSAPSALKLVIAAEEMQDLDDGVCGLDPEHEVLITLYHNHELGYGEIAEKLHIPVGTVKSRLHRARQTLRDRAQRQEARNATYANFVRSPLKAS